MEAMLSRLVCCNTDTNVHYSDEDSSSGDEYGRGTSAAVIRWPRGEGPPGGDEAHADFLVQAGSIRVLPSSVKKKRQGPGHQKSDSVAYNRRSAIIADEADTITTTAGGGARSRVGGQEEKRDGEKPGVLALTLDSMRTSLVSFEFRYYCCSSV